MISWRLPVSAAVLGALALLAAADTAAEWVHTRGQNPTQLAQASPGAPPSPASAAAPAASWHTLTGPDRSFTADMPAAPNYTTREMRSAAGSSYTMHQYLLEQPDVSWVAQTAIYPSDINVSNQRTNLQGGLDNAGKNMESGKWASIGWVTLQGLTAVDAVGERGNHAIRSFSVMKGRQIFTLTYAGPVGSARTPDVDRFIASLHIGP